MAEYRVRRRPRQAVRVGRLMVTAFRAFSPDRPGFLKGGSMDAPKQDPQDKDAERLRDLLGALRAYVEGGCSQRLWGPVAEALKPLNKTVGLLRKCTRAYGVNDDEVFEGYLDDLAKETRHRITADLTRYPGPFDFMARPESLALLEHWLAQMAGPEVPWNPNDPAYIANTDALKLVDKKITLPTLSKALTPDGPMRYMRKGRRCRVHRQDFEKWFDSRQNADPGFWVEVGRSREREHAKKQESQVK